MKYINILKTVAAFAAGALFFSCQRQEEQGEARAVAASETYLSFEAKSAAEQTVDIYADGSWLVDVDSDWISVSRYEGTGMGSITISVADNVSGGVEDLPRVGKITVQGGSALRNAVITVHQNGDTYKGVQTLSLEQVAELEDGQVAKIASAQVVALTLSGFIATDASRSMYVKGTGVAIGDNISFNGAKTTMGDAAAFEMDEVDVTGSSEVTYPEAKDITDSFASYDYSLTEYISISASLVGTTVHVGNGIQVPLLEPIESLGLGGVDLHKVVIKGYGVGKSIVAVSVEDGGIDESLIPYPLKFRVGADINYNTASWSETSRIPPVSGLGYIEYVPFDLDGTNGNNKYALDVSANNPRVTGPWPGDYWLFYGNGAIKAGSEVHIAFESRTSATGHKFWILEFLDGTEWRPACETFTTSDPGEEIVYTHAMNADGATNVQADYVVKYRKNSEHAQFRFRCVANWQANGAGALKARNGGSARITVTDPADPTYQPAIEIIKEGNGIEKDPVYANIEVSTDLLTFNGTPGAPKTITVTSDYDFTVSTTADWLSFDVTEGLAGEETAIAITCAPSELSELRQAVIKIVSEDSEKAVNVVQSAAGQMLDPFISVSSGNRLEVPALEGSKVVKIQSNVDFTAESLAAWITLEKVETKAMVDWTEYNVTYAANEDEAERTGQIRFFNEEKNLETLVTFVQAGKEPEPLYPAGVYFQDDFEWLSAWSAFTVDDVANNSVASSSPNIFTKTDVADALTAFVAKGYGYIWGWKGQEWSDGTPDSGNKQTLYLMKNYLKFGKTDYNSGIILPALSTISGTADVDLTFDWCWCMTGAKKPDTMTLTVTVSGGGTIADTGTEVSGKIESSQPTEGDLTKLEWQNAKVRIIGATPSTRITIRPTDYDPTVSNSARRQNRWYLDNIKVAEPEPAKAQVNDVLWSENWVGGAAGDTPEAYQAKETCSTVVFGGSSVTYTQNSTSTKLYDDGLVYYNDKANITDEGYRNNLLVTKGNGFLNVDGIPCNNVKTATLTYKSNSKLEGNHQVTTSTAGVTVGTLAESHVAKFDLDTKNTYTLTCTITFDEGVNSFDLKLTNLNTQSNIRVDGFELVVTEAR